MCSVNCNKTKRKHSHITAVQYKPWNSLRLFPVSFFIFIYKQRICLGWTLVRCCCLIHKYLTLKEKNVSSFVLENFNICKCVYFFPLFKSFKLQREEACFKLLYQTLKPVYSVFNNQKGKACWFSATVIIMQEFVFSHSEIFLKRICSTTCKEIYSFSANDSDTFVPFMLLERNYSTLTARTLHLTTSHSQTFAWFKMLAILRVSFTAKNQI